MKTPAFHNVKCPDGVDRRFTVQTVHGPNRVRGYVQVGGVTVGGFITRKDERYRWTFSPNMEGKNAKMLRVQAISRGTEVRVTDPAIPEYLRKYRARIAGIHYNGGLTPTYMVVFNVSKPLHPRPVPHNCVELAN
jgi:hypothetical protein